LSEGSRQDLPHHKGHIALEYGLNEVRDLAESPRRKQAVHMNFRPSMMMVAGALVVLCPAQASGLSDDDVMQSAPPTETAQFIEQPLIRGNLSTFITSLDLGGGRPFWLVGSVNGGRVGEGLSPFPNIALPLTLTASISPGDVGWGLIPYAGVVSGDGLTPAIIFDSHWLSGNSPSLEGIAGLTYELMPGLGTGIEYRYKATPEATPFHSNQSPDQVIMMRLDIGLN
jgi:hypothetical protein